MTIAVLVRMGITFQGKWVGSVAGDVPLPIAVTTRQPLQHHFMRRRCWRICGGSRGRAGRVFFWRNTQCGRGGPVVSAGGGNALLEVVFLPPKISVVKCH